MKETQTYFWSGEPDYTPTDPQVQPKDKPRLSEYAAKILARLRQGSAMNYELDAIGGCNYRARISDLRKKGFVIVQDNGKYRLVRER